MVSRNTLCHFESYKLKEDKTNIENNNLLNIATQNDSIGQLKVDFLEEEINYGWKYSELVKLFCLEKCLKLLGKLYHCGDH